MGTWLLERDLHPRYGYMCVDFRLVFGILTKRLSKGEATRRDAAVLGEDRLVSLDVS